MQIRAPTPALIIHLGRGLLRAISGNRIEQIRYFAVFAVALDEAGEGILPNAPALAASNLHGIELADQIGKDDCALAGHDTSPHGLILGCAVLFPITH